MPATMDSQMGTPCVIMTDMATTDSPYTDPTERSISPDTMTMVMPTARMPRMETWRTMFIRLSRVRNTGVETLKTITRITSPAKMPISLTLKRAARGLARRVSGLRGLHRGAAHGTTCRRGRHAARNGGAGRAANGCPAPRALQ